MLAVLFLELIEEMNHLPEIGRLMFRIPEFTALNFLIIGRITK